MDPDSPAGHDCAPLGTSILTTHTRIEIAAALDVGALHDDDVDLFTHTRPAALTRSPPWIPEHPASLRTASGPPPQQAAH